MRYQDEEFIATSDLLFEGVLRDVRKSREALQPIYEALTNAFEAIKCRIDKDKTFHSSNGSINIVIKAQATTDVDNPEFSSISIQDNGIGFNDEDFKRFNTYKDFTKGFSNLGSGRIQYVHYFDNTRIISVFREDELYYKREFTVSKRNEYLKAHNALVYHKICAKTDDENIGTLLIFNGLLENSKVYNDLTANILKYDIIKKYLSYLCKHRDTFPCISIKYEVNGEERDEQNITKQDIPSIDKTDYAVLHYQKIAADGKSYEQLEKTEKFTIDSFRISNGFLTQNALKLTSKGVIVNESPIVLQNLASNTSINGCKYLFLVSSEYIDKQDSNVRGELKIPTKNNAIKGDLFDPEFITLDDIQESVTTKIDSMYPEIQKKKVEAENQLEEIKQLFHYSSADIEEAGININDSEDKIIEKIHEVESKKGANLDIIIKRSYDSLKSLDTSDANYEKTLKQKTKELVKAIPLRNKNALTQYVARRGLLLDLFEKILGKQTDIQIANPDKHREDLLHNLFFHQHSEDSINSDLWMLNEDFIYFNGISEALLSKVQIDGENLFTDEFVKKEDEYLTSLGEDRTKLRPDILLFPSEGKCIIIEFKAQEVNISKYLDQINKYAGLILNYAQPKYNMSVFYGYLIGESIEPRDVQIADGHFENAYQMDYMFKPADIVRNFFGRPHGSIYTEVIKYSTLLERARQRNRIFLKKLNMIKH
ncbi:ATP-binding protein [Bacteroides acidifaciens]|uniref:ATP-binding protein n=1 Tax=Bacteroides acidifaciens TaxID=85831 RepID=UPI00257111C2|nr:ATP-binding protein [Bacteroides acidifaciens]